jgi:hypothetical protein
MMSDNLNWYAGTGIQPYEGSRLRTEAIEKADTLSKKTENNPKRDKKADGQTDQ